MIKVLVADFLEVAWLVSAVGALSVLGLLVGMAVAVV